MLKHYAIALVCIIAFGIAMIYGLKRVPLELPLIGKQAPSISAPLYDSQKEEEQVFSFQYPSQKWTILHFWTSNCYICRVEAPALEAFYLFSKSQALHNQHASASSQKHPPFIFLTVNIRDRKEDIKTWMLENKLTFPVILDQDGKVSVDYGVIGTPETFFINPEGKIQFRVSGEVTNEELQRILYELQKSPS